MKDFIPRNVCAKEFFTEANSLGKKCHPKLTK